MKRFLFFAVILVALFLLSGCQKKHMPPAIPPNTLVYRDGVDGLYSVRIYTIGNSRFEASNYICYYEGPVRLEVDVFNKFQRQPIISGYSYLITILQENGQAETIIAIPEWFDYQGFHFKTCRGSVIIWKKVPETQSPKTLSEKPAN